MKVNVRADVRVERAAGRAVLSAPGTGRRVALPEAALPLLALADGTRDAAALVAELRARHGIGLKEADVQALLAKLCGAGLAVDVTGLRLQTLPAARFDCSGCGHCCRAFAVGPLEDDFVARLDALDLSVTGIEGPYVDEYEDASGRPVRYLLARGGRCVFLTGDDRCALHLHFGAEAKPVGCRLFPLVARWSGGALRLAVNPECQGVRHATGAEDATPLEAQAGLALWAAGGPPEATDPAATALFAVGDRLLEELVGRAAPPLEEALAAMAALAVEAAEREPAAPPDPADAPRLESLYAEALTRRAPFDRQDEELRLDRATRARARLEREGWALPMPALDPVAERVWRNALAHPLFLGELTAELGVARATGVVLCLHAALKALVPAAQATDPLAAADVGRAVDLATSDAAHGMRLVEQRLQAAPRSAAALRDLAGRLLLWPGRPAAA